MRLSSLAFLFASSTLAFACATGSVTTADDGTGDPTVDDDSGVVNPNPYGAKDAGGGTHDSGSGFDAGSTFDSGSGFDAGGTKDTGSPIDSGSLVDTNPPPTGGDCTGTTSQQLSQTYDDSCDAYYLNTFGQSNNCTPGANTCAALNGQGGYTFCCYKPPSGSNCDFDYNGVPQCIPQ